MLCNGIWKQKRSRSLEWLLLVVVPPGIEPRSQGQFIDNVSPLLYQLSYGTNTTTGR